MKCSICGREMIPVEDGTWFCNNCKVGFNDLVFRPTPSGCTTSNKVLDGMYELPKPEYQSSGAMGWICPKCGRALSPSTSVCPCYWDNVTPTCEVKK